MGGLKPPEKPAGIPIQYKIVDRDNLSCIAARYHTEVSTIMTNNKIKNPTSIREGQVITVDSISDKAWAQYQQDLAIYNEQVAEQQHANEVAQRKQESEALIEKAKKDGYSDRYSFSINEEGHIVITLKGERLLKDIRSDFHLAPGVLLATNPSIEDKYKPQKAIRHDGIEYETYDYTPANPRDSFTIDVKDFKTAPPKKSWGDALIDLWHSIIK